MFLVTRMKVEHGFGYNQAHTLVLLNHAILWNLESMKLLFDWLNYDCCYLGGLFS